jgi:peptidoglycan-N-acetylglucosamine deacetylase
MSVLQWCWVAVAVTTVIFLIVAAISALPKMKAGYTAGIAAVFLAASGITAFGSLSPILSAVGLRPPGLSAPYKLPAAPAPGMPLANDARNGKVVFTFDDGPDVHTGQVIAELNALHLHGVFFAIGDKAAAHPEIIRAEVANGEVVGNHTWDHRSLTGKGTGTRPLTPAQVRDELFRADAAIVTAGAPEPSLWRPPYGAVNAADDAIARSLGLRIVLDSGTNIIDSNDWDGLTAAQIAARVDPVLRDGTIVAFHDGLRTAVPATIRALPLIVAYMNAHHLGATTTVRPDATGGMVPYVGPALPAQAPASAGTPAATSARGAALAPGAEPIMAPTGASAPAAPAKPGRTASPPLTPTSPAPTPTPTPPAPTPTPPPTTAPDPTTPAPATDTPTPPSATPAPATDTPTPAAGGTS